LKSINEVTLTGSLIGNVTPSFSNDKAVICFTLETCEALFDPVDEQRRFAAELHTVRVFGELAVRLSQQLNPGMQVYVRGKQKRTGTLNLITEVIIEDGGIAFQICDLVSKRVSESSQPKQSVTPAHDLIQRPANFTAFAIEESPRVAVISTGHVMVDDAMIMPDLCWNSETEDGHYWIQTAPGGWIIRIGNCEEWEQELINNGISYYALHNLKMLEKAGYSWIHFDASAQVIKGLNFWDW